MKEKIKQNLWKYKIVFIICIVLTIFTLIEMSISEDDSVKYIGTVTETREVDGYLEIDCKTKSGNLPDMVQININKKDIKDEIEIGKTYEFKIGQAMTMSIPPQVTGYTYKEIK